MGHRTLIVIAGAIWLVVGISLLSFGVNLILGSIQGGPSSLSPINFFSLILKDRAQAALLVVTTGLYIGYLKGRFVLRKSAERQMGRILNMAPPLSLKNIYSPAYLLLIALMMGMGMLLRYLPIAQDLRGFIDLAVGSGLIQGATAFFRKAIARTST